MTKLDLLKSLRQLQHTEDQYFASLPSDISMAFVDNGYTQCLQEANALLMREAFGALADDVIWFMYEFQNGYSIVEADGTEHCFGSDEEFYVYFQTLCDKESK
jgi:hypothetical protein